MSFDFEVIQVKSGLRVSLYSEIKAKQMACAHHLNQAKILKFKVAHALRGCVWLPIYIESVHAARGGCHSQAHRFK